MARRVTDGGTQPGRVVFPPILLQKSKIEQRLKSRESNI
jgi:hypothetical protein